MRVLLLGKYYPPVRGGIESYVASLAGRLGEIATVRILVCNNQPATVHEQIGPLQITRVACYGELASTPICPSLPYWFKKITQDAYDIIHTQFPSPFSELAILLNSQTCQSKLVVTYHSDVIKQARLVHFYKPIISRILQRADRIIATSENYIHSSPFLKPLENKCTVVPLGVDISDFAYHPLLEPERQALRREYGDNFILFVGRFVTYKGLSYLVDSMANVDTNLVLVGSGPLEGKIRAQIKKLNLEKKVKILNNPDSQKLRALYHACGVFVLPSTTRNEAFGLVQVEAMAAGKPVVSTALDTGVPFVNQHLETGLVVPPADSRILAESLQRLCHDDQFRTKCGENAFRRAQQHFDISEMYRKTYKVYLQVLGEC